MTRKFNVITPLSRYDNIKYLIDALESHDITWHVITDKSIDFEIVFKKDWIKSYISPTEGKLFWERSNNSINWFLNNYNIIDDEYYCFLNDDDSYEYNFFDKLNTFLNSSNGDVVICSMDRGDKIPENVKAERRHPNDKIIASPDICKVTKVGLEQIILKGKILKNYKIPVHVYGDGMLIEQIVKENKTVYAPNINVYFNYFEHGRWNSFSGNQYYVPYQ